MPPPTYGIPPDASPTEIAGYFSSIDPDFAKASNEDKAAYMGHVTGRSFDYVGGQPIDLKSGQGAVGAAQTNASATVRKPLATARDSRKITPTQTGKAFIPGIPGAPIGQWTDVEPGTEDERTHGFASGAGKSELEGAVIGGSIVPAVGGAADAVAAGSIKPLYPLARGLVGGYLGGREGGNIGKYAGGRIDSLTDDKSGTFANIGETAGNVVGGIAGGGLLYHGFGGAKVPALSRWGPLADFLGAESGPTSMPINKSPYWNEMKPFYRTRLSAGSSTSGIPEIAEGSLRKRLTPLIYESEPQANQIDALNKRLSNEASKAGMYSAARGKVGRPLDYQERIGKRIPNVGGN